MNEVHMDIVPEQWQEANEESMGIMAMLELNPDEEHMESEPDERQVEKQVPRRGRRPKNFHQLLRI